MKKETPTKKMLMVTLAGFLFFFLLATPFALADGTITVLNPNGPTRVERGSTLDILYEITGVIQGKISAYLFRQGRNVGKIADDLNKYPGKHVERWTVGDTISGSSNDGIYTIGIMDEDNTIAGYSEGRLVIVSADLYISRVRVEKAHSNSSGDYIALWTTVKRTGAKLYLKPTEDLTYSIRCGNVNRYAISARYIDQLNDRGETTLWETLKPPYKPSVRIKIDDPYPQRTWGTVRESNENNNTFVVSIPMKILSRFPTAPRPTNSALRRSWHKAFPGVQPTPIKPDLRITRWRYSESGGKVWLTLHIVNATFDKGSRLPSLSTNSLSLYTTCEGAYFISKTEVNTLNRSGSVDRKIECLNLANSGKSCRIIIDASNVVVETNEHNNEITVPAYVRKITQTPQSLKSGSKSEKTRKKSPSKSAPVRKLPSQPQKRPSK